MKTEVNCPVCYAYIEMEDDAGYCVMCDEVIYKEKDGTLKSDVLEGLNENHQSNKRRRKKRRG